MIRSRKYLPLFQRYLRKSLSDQSSSRSFKRFLCDSTVVDQFGKSSNISFDWIANIMMDTEIVQLLSTNKMKTDDPNLVVDKLKKLLDDGAACLHIITDFDHTISKSRTSTGEANINTARVFRTPTCGIDPDLKSEMESVRDKFLPIETDPKLTIDEKIPHMEEWRKTSRELMMRAKIDRTLLEQYVRDAKIELRDGFLEFLRLTEEYEIPIVIISAGNGNVIEVVIRQQYGHIPNNLHVFSNMMKFDKSGVHCGYEPYMVHAFNKNYSVIKGNERTFSDELRSRPNILIMGDAVSDANMDVGEPRDGAVVKLGFLNNQPAADKHLPSYLDSYDIVLADDQTFHVPLGILKQTIAQEKNGSRIF